MPSKTDKLVGLLIWRLVRWYLWRRYGTTLKRAGASAIAAVVIGGAVVAAQQRRSASSG